MCLNAAWHSAFSAKCPHPWHFSFRWKGQDYRFSLDRYLGKHVESRTEAEGEAEKIRLAIRAGKFGVPAADPPSAPEPESSAKALLFRVAVERYGREFVDQPMRRATAAIEMRRLMNTWRDAVLPDGRVLGDVPLDALGADDYRAVMDARHARTKVRGDKGGRVATNRMLSRLRHFYGWCLERGLAPASPFVVQAGRSPLRLVRGVEQPRSRRVQPGEADRLLNVAGPHLRAMIIAALDTGMRMGELLAVTFADFDWRRGVLTVRSQVSKTSTGREVPVTERVRDLIAARRLGPDGQPHPQSAHIFGDPCGAPIKDIKTAWLGTCRRAGVAGLHFNDLRREAGSRLLEAGVALHVVSTWLGHSSVSQTATYLSIHLPQLHDARGKLEASQNAIQEAARLAAENRAQDPSACKNVANWDEAFLGAEIATPVSSRTH